MNHQKYKTTGLDTMWTISLSFWLLLYFYPDKSLKALGNCEKIQRARLSDVHTLRNTIFDSLAYILLTTLSPGYIVILLAHYV